MRLLLLGTAIALALGVGTASAGSLQPNRAGSCMLGGGVAAAIKVALAIANQTQNLGLDISKLSVDSIVIRSAENLNGGQRLKVPAGTTSGPIACTFNAGILPPSVPYTIAPTTAATEITGVNLLASQVEGWVQYKKTDRAKKIENLLCLTTLGSDECFSIFRTGVPR